MFEIVAVAAAKAVAIGPLQLVTVAAVADAAFEWQHFFWDVIVFLNVSERGSATVSLPVRE